MTDNIFERVFKYVPHDLRDEYLEFLQKHPWKFLQINEQKWEYLDSGSGKPILIVVPGGMRRPAVGWRLLQQLEKKYRVISPAYPTTGSMSVLAQGVIAIADKEGIDRFAILGSSYGGLVSQTILQIASDRISHAIIANTGTITEDTSFVKRIGRSLRLMRIVPASLVSRISKNSFKGLLSSIEKDRVIYEAIIDELFERKWLTKKDMLCHFQGLLDFQLNHKFTPEDTRRWTTKILIIKSSDDPGVGEGSSVALDKMFPTARTYVFENAGHMPSITRADEYLELVEDFLRT